MDDVLISIDKNIAQRCLRRGPEGGPEEAMAPTVLGRSVNPITIVSKLENAKLVINSMI